MPTTTLEICVDSLQGLAAASAGGADRIELCSALGLGGLTPSPGLMAQAGRATLPCHAMIRPRAGDFVLRAGDLDAMRGDIAAARSTCLAGVVIGAALPDAALDTDTLGELIGAAKGMEVTLHRVFDLTPDPFAALDAAMALGVRRVLTSGQAATALQGADLLARLVKHAAGRIEIMAGGGVTAENAPALISTGVDALHASASSPDPQHMDCTRIGIPAPKRTDSKKVAGLRAALTP